MFLQFKELDLTLEILTAFTGFLYFFTETITGIIVGINSLFFHISYGLNLDCTRYFHQIDLLFNISFISFFIFKLRYNNIKLSLIAILSCVIFVLNHYLDQYKIVHILGVQLPLLYCYLKL